MSEVENVLNNQNSSFTNYDTSKLFIGNNKFPTNQYVNNSTYDPIVLKAGTLMGRVGSTGVLVPSQSDAADGSQNPVGVLAQDLSVEAGDTVTATICDGGDVVKNKVIFVKPGDNMETIISNRRYKDLIQAETHIKLVESTEQTGLDNQ